MARDHPPLRPRLIAWQPDGQAFFTLDAHGSVVRHALDGTAVPVGRVAPQRHPRALVFFGGRLRVVAPVRDVVYVEDLENGIVVLHAPVVGDVTHARIERPAPGREYLMTRASSVVFAGGVSGRRTELAWFGTDGRRVHRVLRRGTLAAALPPDDPLADTDTATALSDGMLVDGDELVSPRAVGEDRQRLGRFTDAPVRAVVAESTTQTRWIFLLGADGLITATAANDVRRWYGVVRGLAFERLYLSGDGALLCATAGRVLACWNAADGALRSVRELAGEGTLHPSPVGRDAVWLTRDGPQRIDLAPSPVPIAAPARFDHAVTIENLALVVRGDTDGILTDLVRATVGDGPSPVAANDPGGPTSLLEPWSVRRGEASTWIDGFLLRRILAEAPVQEAERLRRLDKRDASLALEARRNATLADLRVSDALEEAIFAQPSADEPYLVYGDWLLEHGDPRGELVAVQVGLRAAPGDAELRARERVLLALHGTGWLGTLARDFAGEWHLGFMRALVLPRARASTWRELRTLPILRFVERLTVTLPGSPTDFIVAVETLGAPRLLRELVLHGPLSEQDRARLVAALPTTIVTF